MNIKLASWMNKGNIKQYVDFINKWFAYVEDILKWPLQQFDVEKCELFVVDLLAWERDVQRYTNEPEWLYRLRVKHAYQNARDAGSTAGFKKIWERMGLGYLEVSERMPGRDFDIVGLKISNSSISDHPELLDIMIEKYGRTCRRYEWTTQETTQIKVRSTSVHQVTNNVTARL